MPASTGFDDPALPRTPSEEHRFPCDTCGSDLRFDPERYLLVCDHCGNTEEISGARGVHSPIAELDFQAALASALPQSQMEETRVTTCPNCAVQEYARKGRKMQGIYVPYWTYDADTRSSYSGERGTVYYVTQTVMRDGKRVQQQVPKIRWRATSGRVARFFDDVLVLASTSLPKRFTDALAPWDLAALEPYAPEYLAGFRAEAYAVTLEEGYAQAREVMDAMIQRDVRFDIGGDRQRIHNIQTQVSDVTFKHILLPVWLAAYKYRGKTYRFVVNGRTGSVQGERPYSTVKITFAVILGLIVAGIVGYFMALQK